MCCAHTRHTQGKIKKLDSGVGSPGGGRKWPAVLWKIARLDLAGWQDMLAKKHVRVINMLMTKTPHVVGDGAPAPPPMSMATLSG